MSIKIKLKHGTTKWNIYVIGSKILVLKKDKNTINSGLAVNKRFTLVQLKQDTKTYKQEKKSHIIVTAKPGNGYHLLYI